MMTCPTGWIFLILLFLAALAGFAVHVTRLEGLHFATYCVYVIHLMIAVPMLIIDVSFGKREHLEFRPLVIYLMRVKERAREVTAVSVVAA